MLKTEFIDHIYRENSKSNASAWRMTAKKAVLASMCLRQVGSYLFLKSAREYYKKIRAAFAVNFYAEMFDFEFSR